jgi:hypothetical protein
MTRIAVLSVFLCLGTIAHATVVVPADLQELSRRATTIVRGSVVSVESRWLEDRGSIETLVTLQAEAYLKGPLGQTVQFRVPGGQVGRYRRLVIGAPSFAAGQRVVVFLGTSGPSIPHVIGLNQGVFRIDRGQVTPPAALPGVRVASNIRSGVTAKGQSMPLRDFETRVRALSGARR